MPNYTGPKTCVTHPGGRVKAVKNLGWLLAHAASVRTITLSPRDDGARCGCRVIASLEDGRTYRTSFNDLGLCRDWMVRPSLDHVTLVDECPAT